MEKIKGQPKKAMQQEKRVHFALTAKQYFVIQQKAAKAGLTIPGYMRQVAVNGEVKPKWTEEEYQMVEQMVGMSEGIHQLVLQAQKEGVTHAALSFTRYRGVFDEIIHALRDNR